MKNRKSVKTLVAAVASLTLIFATGTPASAANTIIGGTINCPSNMAAKVSFNTKSAGNLIYYYSNGKPQSKVNHFNKSAKVRGLSYRAPVSGKVSWNLVVVSDSNISAYVSCGF